MRLSNNRRTMCSTWHMEVQGKYGAYGFYTLNVASDPFVSRRVVSSASKPINLRGRFWRSRRKRYPVIDSSLPFHRVGYPELVLGQVRLIFETWRSSLFLLFSIVPSSNKRKWVLLFPKSRNSAHHWIDRTDPAMDVNETGVVAPRFGCLQCQASPRPLIVTSGWGVCRESKGNFIPTRDASTPKKGAIHLHKGHGQNRPLVGGLADLLTGLHPNPQPAMPVQQSSDKPCHLSVCVPTHMSTFCHHCHSSPRLELSRIRAREAITHSQSFMSVLIFRRS